MADLFRFFRRQYAKHAPTQEDLRRSPLLKPLGQRIWASELWRFTRRSVPIFHADLASFQRLSAARAPFREWLAWLASDAAPALVSGLALIALGVAFAGYLLSLVVWRLWIGSKWRSRLHRRSGLKETA